MEEQAVAAIVQNTILERLKKRYQKAKGIADLWQSLLEACFHYAIPNKNRFYLPTGDFQGDMRNARVYDTTAVDGTKTFVSKIHSTMTPPRVQWGFLEVDPIVWKDPTVTLADVQRWQQILNDYMRKLFTFVHASNFDVIINECYYDLAIGTSCIVINQGDDKRPIVCTSIPMDKMAIEEAANGRVESWYRTWENLKINELKTRWQNIILSDDMIVDLMQDQDAVVKKLYEGVAYFPDGVKPYCYVVWSDNAVLLQEWTDSNPGIVWRFQKVNNETWGRGPVMDALPSIITLNELAMIDMCAANLNVFKPFMAFSDTIFNPHTFKLAPFSIIPIAPIGIGGSAPLIPLPSSADPNYAQMKMADLRMQVKTLLFAETASDSLSVQPQTAYELGLKQQTLAEKIGPLFSRHEQEFLAPVINRIAYILHNMGLLPKPDIDGKPIRFRYKSPLALSQGQQDVARFTQFVQIMQGTMGADVTQVYINPKTTPYKLADSLQVDPDYLNDADSVAQVMQQQQNNMSALPNAEAETPQQPQNPSEQTIMQ